MNLTTKNLTSMVLAVGVIAAQQATAGTINGSIAFSGLGTLDTGNILTATAFTSLEDFTVAVGTGSYSSIPKNTAVTVPSSGFIFNPGLTTSPLNSVWSITYGGKTYSFDLYNPLSTSETTTGGVPFLNVSGAGIAHITGDTDAHGVWSITTSGTTTTFDFSEHTTVPDGGSSLVLLGCGLVGIGFLRRRL